MTSAHDAAPVTSPSEVTVNRRRRRRRSILGPQKSLFRRKSFFGSWAISSMLLLLLCGLWTLITPIPSGPDEPTQYVKAAAVAGGTITGSRKAHFPPGTVLVKVRGTFVMYDPSTNCYYEHPTVPAGCSPALGGSPRVGVTTTYVGDYPPLYYALAGLPSAFSSRPAARRAMRIMSALISALLLGLALGVAITWARSRWMIIGSALTITPAAVYLASVINPNGLEISAAVAAWTAGVVLVFDHDEAPPGGLIAAFVGSAVVLAFTRPLSPLWVLGIVAALAIVRPGPAWRLVRNATMRIPLAVTLVATLGAMAYIILNRSLAIEHFPLAGHPTNTQVAALILGRLPFYAQSLVGQFGAPEFIAPTLAAALWVVGVGALVSAAVVVGARWQCLVLLLIVVGVLAVLPFVATYPNARTLGVAWQGRYEYPLAAGIPLVAAAMLGAVRVRVGRAPLATAVAVAVGHLATFYWVLRRYTVGLGTFLNPFAHVPNGWQPPLPSVALAALAILVVGAYGAWLVVCCDGHLRFQPESRSVEAREDTT